MSGLFLHKAGPEGCPLLPGWLPALGQSLAESVPIPGGRKATPQPEHISPPSPWPQDKATSMSLAWPAGQE